MGKVQQAYVPKSKNQIIEVDGQLVSNTHKKGDVVGKEKQNMMDGGSKGAIYKTNLLYKRMETIKTTSANPFHLLVGLEVDDTRDKLEGDNKGNYTYFNSDDEEEDVDDPAPRNEDQMQNIEVAENITNVEEMAISAKSLGSGPVIKEVDAEVVASASSDVDFCELKARGSSKKIENKLPMGFILENQGSESDNGKQDSESEAEEEESIRSYGKPPAECGMPPMLTMANPKFRGEIDMPKENKKEKK